LLAKGRVVTCVYCGHKYEGGTPESQDKRLTDHIAGCEKHPMHKVVQEREQYLAELLEVRQLYHELIDAVVKRNPGETRHETALKHIRAVEEWRGSGRLCQTEEE
jgi:ribosomal 50S subunit-associated protein YjgA (DUF615 family)